MRHSPLENLARHDHSAGFAALILSGNYVEAGDSGRHLVGPGDVLIHDEFESHVNRFDSSGAEVLLLPFARDAGARWQVDDADAVVRAAERGIEEGSQLLRRTMRPIEIKYADWPDKLARDLELQRSLRLDDWADKLGIRPETLSRGFRLAYGCTPALFRANARARAAWREIRNSPKRLVEIAADHGFADQAHMTRAIRKLTGQSPGAWRAQRGAQRFRAS